MTPIGIIVTVAFLSVFVAFAVVMWRIDRGPYGFAFLRIPLLCKASADPRRLDSVPPWVERLVTQPRVWVLPPPRVACVLPDLLGGRVEVAYVEQGKISFVAVRCPHVAPPRDLTRGTIVAANAFLLSGRRELEALAVVRVDKGNKDRITIYLRRGTGQPFQPDEQAIGAIDAAFHRGFWRGLSSVEVHDGAVYLIFDGVGSRWLRPRHIAAVCEALDAGRAGGGTPS